MVSTAVVDKLVALATLHTDKQLQTEGLSLNLEEDINLELPFHVPEDGYYCDGLVGVPPGLQEYLESAVNAGGFERVLMCGRRCVLVCSGGVCRHMHTCVCVCAVCAGLRFVSKLVCLCYVHALCVCVFVYLSKCVVWSVYTVA